jgi:protein SCO1/2
VKRAARCNLAALFVGAMIAVSGCPSLAPAPPVLGQVPEFEMVGDDGKPFGSASLAGKPWLASFLFTSCPGPCPKLVERLKALRAGIPASELAFVSFSVDPLTDTPGVLAQYKKQKGIGADAAWTFVTGPEDRMLELVRRGFLVAVEKSNDPAGEDGAVIHGVRVGLIDGQRRIRGYYNTELPEDLERLERELAALE